MTLNFTVGPVQSNDYICSIGSEQVPYFRNEIFSNIVFESESLIKKFLNAPSDSKVLFITGSGTASMEASIINIFNKSDKLLIINGGTFGSRFVDICNAYGYKYDEIKLLFGKNITYEDLESHYSPDITGILINVDETSSGVKYDMNVVSVFAKKYNLILIADIISSFLADENNMIKHNVDAYIIGSQKALACHPGVSILVLSKRSLDRINHNRPASYYLDLKIAITNAERGQTPFTPAVGIIRQINTRLKMIEKNGGVETEIRRVQNLAMNFRSSINNLPLEFVTTTPSNAVTALYLIDHSAKKLFNDMYTKHDIWICPNGGEYADSVFRIGHIGDLTLDDNNRLIKALNDELLK